MTTNTEKKTIKDYTTIVQENYTTTEIKLAH